MNFGNSCTFDPPYIGQCNYNGAYEALEHIYGNLKVIGPMILLLQTTSNNSVYHMKSREEYMPLKCRRKKTKLMW